MNFVHTTILVNNLEKSIEFYNKLIGLKIINKMELGTKQLVFLGSGETQIELIYTGEEHTNPETMNISIGFACDDLDEIIKQLTNSGYAPITDIIKINEFVRFTFFKDPDGFKVQLLERK